MEYHYQVARATPEMTIVRIYKGTRSNPNNLFVKVITERRGLRIFPGHKNTSGVKERVETMIDRAVQEAEDWISDQKLAIEAMKRINESRTG